MPSSGSKLGFNATWSIAVGGMVGGGIFSTLGVFAIVAMFGRPILLRRVAGSPTRR